MRAQVRSAPGSRKVSPHRDADELHLSRPSARVHHREMTEERQQREALQERLAELTAECEAALASSPTAAPSPGAPSPLPAMVSVTPQVRSEEIV